MGSCLCGDGGSLGSWESMAGTRFSSPAAALLRSKLALVFCAASKTTTVFERTCIHSFLSSYYVPGSNLRSPGYSREQTEIPLV